MDPYDWFCGPGSHLKNSNYEKWQWELWGTQAAMTIQPIKEHLQKSHRIIAGTEQKLLGICWLLKSTNTIRLKGIVHPEMKILLLITHPHVIPNPQDLCSLEHKLRYFWWNLSAFWTYIDSKGTTTVKAQKHSRDIVKIVHVHQWLILILWKENKNNDFVQWFLLFRVSPPPFTRVPCGTLTNGGRLSRKSCWTKSLFLFSLHTKSILVGS